MATQINFANVPVGVEFFDPESGNDFVKISNLGGVVLDGGDAIEGRFAAFEDDELVQITGA